MTRRPYLNPYLGTVVVSTRAADGSWVTTRHSAPGVFHVLGIESRHAQEEIAFRILEGELSRAEAYRPVFFRGWVAMRFIHPSS